MPFATCPVETINIRKVELLLILPIFERVKFIYPLNWTWEISLSCIKNRWTLPGIDSTETRQNIFADESTIVSPPFSMPSKSASKTFVSFDQLPQFHIENFIELNDAYFPSLMCVLLPVANTNKLLRPYRPKREMCHSTKIYIFVIA